MDNTSKIDILMATYNGGQFIEEQIDSILNQTHKNWHLWIRDDRSTDNTLELLENYKIKYPEKISIIKDDRGNLGHVENFNEISKYSSAPFAAFADQDDIWNDNKLEKLLNVTDGNNEIPILVHSDFSYINECNEEIVSSYQKYVKKNITNCNKYIVRSLYFGVCVGCTVLINRKLLKLSMPVPTDFSIGHDHWLLYTSILLGKHFFVDKALIQHRVHKNNTGGKKIHEKKSLPTKLNKSELILKKIKTSKKLLDRYNSMLNESERLLLSFHSQLYYGNISDVLVFFFRSHVFYLSHVVYSCRTLLNMLWMNYQKRFKYLKNGSII